MDRIDKADHVTALLDAVGLEGAWQAVLDAPADKLDDATKQTVQREIITRQLQRAQDMIKADGMGPPVLELLRLLVALLAPAAAAEPPMDEPPPEAEPPMDETEQAAELAAPPAEAEPADDLQAKELPPPEQAPSTMRDDPRNLATPPKGQTGDDGNYVEASKADGLDAERWLRQADVAPERHPMRERQRYVKR